MVPVGLHELIEAQARRTPGQVAVVFEQERLTYGELDRRADTLAHRLRTLGVGPDLLVGLFVERSLEMVVGILGILKAGAAYVPIDAGYPAERIAFMLADANVRVLLTQPRGKSADRCRGGDLSGRLRLERLSSAAIGRVPGPGGEPRLCDLHEWLDGPSQGCLHRASQHRQLRAGRRRTSALRARDESCHGVDDRRRPRQHRDFPGAGHRRLPARHLAGASREPGALV